MHARTHTSLVKTDRTHFGVALASWAPLRCVVREFPCWLASAPSLLPLHRASSLVLCALLQRFMPPCSAGTRSVAYCGCPVRSSLVHGASRLRATSRQLRAASAQATSLKVGDTVLLAAINELYDASEGEGEQKEGRTPPVVALLDLGALATALCLASAEFGELWRRWLDCHH
eukprot:5546177-Pleurochrysis_carterae.AAC.1